MKTNVLKEITAALMCIVTKQSNLKWQNWYYLIRTYMSPECFWQHNSFLNNIWCFQHQQRANCLRVNFIAKTMVEDLTMKPYRIRHRSEDRNTNLRLFIVLRISYTPFRHWLNNAKSIRNVNSLVADIISLVADILSYFTTLYVLPCFATF